MRFFYAAISILAVGACSNGAVRQDPPPAPVAQAELTEPATDAIVVVANEEPVEGSGIICRREIVSGSHFRRKVCMTAEQREAMQRSAQELMRDKLQTPATVAGDSAQ